MTGRKVPVTRRVFLWDSAVASLIGGSATALSASVSKPTRSFGERHYRIGVIGSTGRGDYGHALDTAWNAFPNCEIVALADDNENGRATAEKRLGLKKSFNDYREMLDEAKPDIACICPRWIDQHHKMALAAAERGIHIYMEKPFVPTLDQADEVVVACAANGVKFALALWTHYSPKLSRVKELIADGAIGRVLEYRCRGKEDHRGGAEDLWVLGIHVLDMIRFLGGHPKWCFAHMSQNGEPVSKRHVFQGNEGLGPLAGNVVYATWGMSDSSVAYFGSHRNAEGDPSRYALQILGTKGIIEIQEGTLPPVKYLADPSCGRGYVSFFSFDRSDGQHLSLGDFEQFAAAKGELYAWAIRSASAKDIQLTSVFTSDSGQTGISSETTIQKIWDMRWAYVILALIAVTFILSKISDTKKKISS